MRIDGGSPPPKPPKPASKAHHAKHSQKHAAHAAEKKSAAKPRSTREADYAYFQDSPQVSTNPTGTIDHGASWSYGAKNIGSKTWGNKNTHLDGPDSGDGSGWQSPEFNHNVQVWGQQWNLPDSVTIGGKKIPTTLYTTGDKTLVDGKYGTVTNNFSAGQLTAQGNAGLTFDPTHGAVVGSVGGSVAANLVDDKVSYTNQYGTTATVEGSVGANAQGTALVAFDPLHGSVGAGVDASAFAGAQITGNVQQQIGPATADVGGSLSYGIGGTFDANAGLEHGKLVCKCDVGATLGLGASVNVDFQVDPCSAVKDLSQSPVGGVVQAGGNFLGTAGKDAGGLASNVGNGLGQLGGFFFGH